MAILEHANLTVRSIDESIPFLAAALPDFRVRGQGATDDGQRWAHVGTDDSYVAMDEVSGERPVGGPLNRLGFVVDDVDALADRLKAADCCEGSIAPPHPDRKRRYFHDAEYVEWEFVEYLSDDPADRNAYSL